MRLGPAGVSGGGGVGIGFFDCASFIDRGLSVQSSVSYLREAHHATVLYLGAADFGGQRGAEMGDNRALRTFWTSHRWAEIRLRRTGGHRLGLPTP